jgi:anti-sigma regulatory factor (Ser/Thr protein kinase)
MVMTMLLEISERSQIAEARRIASAEGESIGMNDSEVGTVALAVTEIATNLIKHAGGGSIILRTITSEEWTGLEVISLDRGSGMRDLNACMRDGYSTTGSSGTGLGALARISDLFDIYTQTGRGTVLVARFGCKGCKAANVADSTMHVEAICLPKSGEIVSGDSWTTGATRDGLQVFVADGLGHGPLAAQAAREAVRAFHRSSGDATTSIITNVHDALHGTRGAAAAVADIDVERGEVRFAGVGNISATLFTETKVHRMVSHNGTLGHEMRKTQEFTYPWSHDALMVMHSDGLATHWDLGSYPGLVAHHPSIIAAVLYRDHCRGRDDVTVVVARQKEAA